MKYTDLPPAAKRIAMALHTHAQHWLTLMLKLSKQTLVRKHSLQPKPVSARRSNN